VHSSGEVYTVQSHLPQYSKAQFWTMKFEDFVGYVAVCATPGVRDEAHCNAYYELTHVREEPDPGQQRREMLRINAETLAYLCCKAGEPA
jgi:hypothetical protein